MHMYFYIYACTCEFRPFLESNFCLVFIPNPSIFPESGLNLQVVHASRAPGRELLVGKGG